MRRWLLLPLLLLCTASAQAATRTVTSLADSGSGTLRNTLASASSGDIIVFSVSGNLLLTSGELVIDKSLTISGPSAGITVNGNGNVRCLRIDSGTVSISKFTFTNGSASGTSFADTNSGAGIMNKGTLSLTDCNFTNNAALSTNSGSSAGGAIFNYLATVNALRCTFTSNTATGQNQFIGGEGGAIYNYSGTVNLTDSILNNNAATRGNPSGGGTGGDGGAIAVGGGTLNIKGCAIYNNASTLVGGAIVNINGGSTLSITNSTLAFNSSNSASCIFSNGPTTITASTICNNVASTGAGGGLYTFEAPVKIRGTIIASNFASSASDVSSSGNLTSLGHNLIGITDGSSGWIASDQVGTSSSPLNPQLGPLQNNGGLSGTMLPATNSPAVDMGDDAVLNAPYSLATDQRGPGFVRKRGSHVDVGACEGDAVQTGTSFTVTVNADHDDGMCGLLDCTLREAVVAANAASDANIIKFAPDVTGSIYLSFGQLSVTAPVSIQGPGANVLTINAQQLSRIFNISSGATSVSISKLTLQSGAANSTGGAILNGTSLSLTACTFSNNQVSGTQGGQSGSGTPALGGALFNSGTATVVGCTFTGNQVVGGSGGFGGTSPGGPGGPGGSAFGGAIYNGGTLNLNNSTIHGNFATGGQGGSGTPDGIGGPGQGAGVFNGGTATINSCTISNNGVTGGLFSGPAAAGGISGATTGTVTKVTNTIVAGNTASTGPDVLGTFTSQGFNFIGKGDGASGFVNGTNADQVGSIASPIDPQLGALQNNGGPVLTRALAIGSPAIDKGKTSFTVDQRNFQRPYDNPAVPNATGGNGSDIGAFERQNPGFSIADVSINEGSSGTTNATFTVTLVDPGTSGASVKYATSDGTAKAPGDYTAKALTTLSFSAGQTSKTFTIPIVGDTADEVDETFNVNLSAPTNAVITDSQAKCTIVDDDAPPIFSINDITVSEGDSGSLGGTFTVTLTPASGKTVTVNYATANGTATSPADYSAIPSTTLTFAPGQTSKTFNITHKGDTLSEGDETFFVNLSGATNATAGDPQGICTIADNDPWPVVSINDKTVIEGNSGSVSATFTVSLSPPSGQTVTVGYNTAPGTATPGTDYSAPAPGVLTFSPGQTSKTITVSVKGDTLDEPNETFLVNLTFAANAFMDDTQGVGKIADDDATPSLSINDVSVTEGNSGTSNATFTITLSAASGVPVTVQYVTANGSATAPSDFITIPPTAVTFAPGQKTKTFTVSIVGDTIHESQETFNITLSNPTNATISDTSGKCTINDNDAAALLYEEPAYQSGEASASTSTITLYFEDVVPRDLMVEINGTLVAPDTMTIDGNIATITFPEGKLETGDDVRVSWNGGEAELKVD